MSTVEMKWKIVQQLDNVSDAELIEVINILEGKTTSQNIRLLKNDNLDQILNEHDEVFKKLAQ